MKKILSVFLVLLISTFSVYAQEIVIPKVVSQQLTSIFAKASEVKWSNPSKEKYEAEFKENGVVKTALFSNSGDLLQTLIPVGLKDFPVDVSNSLLKNFPDFEISHSVKIEMGKEISFRVRLKKGKDLFEVEFDLFGKIKSKIRIGGGDDDKEYKKDCDDDDEDEDEYCERHHKKHNVKHKDKHKGHKHKHKD